ncbi:MAG: zinc ribbon domain-containing protein [Candidatus Bathyarchaeia archaeon]
MIPKPALVTSVLLAVAVFTFAALSSQTVPMSTTQSSTEVLTSYSPHFLTNTFTYTTTSTSAYFTETTLCFNGGTGCDGMDYIPYNYWVNTLFTNTLQSTYEMPATAVVPYSQTLTMSSTRLVPASAALGLGDGSFTTLAVVVIGVLALLTAYVTLKPGMTHTPRQATLSQFAKAPSFCIKCGAELPPASEFCNKCGTKQD